MANKEKGVIWVNNTRWLRWLWRRLACSWRGHLWVWWSPGTAVCKRCWFGPIRSEELRSQLPLKWVCKFLPHPRFEVQDTWAEGMCQLLRCPRCGGLFGIHHGVKAFVPWGVELEMARHRDKAWAKVRGDQERKRS